MITNNMENSNGEESNRKKRYCPKGDASKNEHRPQPQVNEAQLEAEDSDQDLTKSISDFKMKGVKPDSAKRQRLGPAIKNFDESVNGKNAAVPNNEDHFSGGDVSMYEHGAQLNVNLARQETASLIQIDGRNSDPLMKQILNTVRKLFGSEQPNEQHMIPKFIDAEGDASKNKHRPQPNVNKAQLEAEDSDKDFRKTMIDFKMKGVKPDSSRGQGLGPVMGHFEESVNGKNPPVPNNEGHCSRGDVSTYEHGAQLNVNFARLETDSLRRYLRHFKIEGINSYSSREQMLNAVRQHFASQPPLNEQQVIPEFIDAARRLKNKDKKT